MAVEVDREQPARVVRQERIDAHHLATLQVPEQLALSGSMKRLVWTFPAPHARLAAHSGLPLVLAARRPATPALGRFLPTQCEDVLAASKEAGEERELALGRPRCDRQRVDLAPGIRS